MESVANENTVLLLAFGHVFLRNTLEMDKYLCSAEDFNLGGFSEYTHESSC